MTVYKSVKLEAKAASGAAIAIIKGKKVKTNDKISNGDHNVPSIFLKPVSITKKNWKLLLRDGFLKRNQVCTGKFKKYCH